MAQTLGDDLLTAAYLKRVQASHDFDVFVDVLDMEENFLGSVQINDGQVNINTTEPRRTCSFPMTQVGGPLSFSQGQNFSGTTLWANRLVRIRHVVTVPGYGEVSVVVFVGVPTALSRAGGIVQVECADKSALAAAGAIPLTVAAGTRATDAIVTILRSRAGEARFRVPTLPRTLSKPYVVGWDDSTSPWAVACAIAKAELGHQLIYSSDGYATLRPVPSSAIVDASYATTPPDSSVDFTQVKNFVQVSGHTPGITAKAVNSPLTTNSPQYLARNGVSRLWPVIITEDGYTTLAQTQARADAELAAGNLTEEVKVTVVPLFHLDVDDIVRVRADDGTAYLRLSSGSIPLGVGTGGEGSADMSIGQVRWGSQRSSPRTARYITARLSG